MPVSTKGAQRASRHRSLRLTVVTRRRRRSSPSAGSPPTPTPAAAAGKKVVIVVGPAGSSTRTTSPTRKKLAAQARSYGASVYEIYSPHATWAKVKSVAQGANVFIYLGHGNGYPSPYGAFSKYTKDGLGLNASAGSSTHKYYGEYYIDTYINFAPNAVVILNRLCYASGNNEWGAGYPDEVDRDPAGRQLRRRLPPGQRRGGLRRGHQQRLVHPARPVQDEDDPMAQIFWSDPAADGRYDFVVPRRRGRRPGTESSIRSGPAATTARSLATWT